MKVRFALPEVPPLPLASLVDVLFIVLCFLFLVARFADAERLDVVLPSTDAGALIVDRPVVVLLAPDGSVQIDGVAIAPEHLERELAARRADTDRALVVADRDTPLQRAVDALSAARRAGFPIAGVATRRPDEPP